MSAILPRSSWTPTANGRAGRGLDRNRVRGFTFHWPATPGVIGAVAQSIVAGLLRTWRAQHIRQSWADIGYNYAIDQAGRIYFLTGLNRGAHAGGSGVGNNESVGILMVIGMGEKPSAAMLDSAAWLTAHLTGALPRATNHWPHSRWTSTDCCGAALRSAIASGATRRRSNRPNTPTTGGSFMSDLSPAEQRRLLRRVDALFDLLQPAQKGVRSKDGTLARWSRETTESARIILRTLSPGGQVRAMVAAAGEVDIKQTFAELSDEDVQRIAAASADELGQRVAR